MKRVYTDEQFPGFEIVNNGAETFEIYEGGKRLTSFVTRAGPVDEATAARCAMDYFKRRWSLTETMDPPEIRRVPDSKDHTEIFNNPVDSREIDKLMAKERAEADPERKKTLRANLLRLMQREVSVPEAVVAHLIET